MTKKQSDSDSPEKQGFEQSLGQLEEIVRQLERGDIGLGQSLAHYEQGVKLLRRCYDLLEKAERRIELLSGVDAEGRPVTTPVDDSDLCLEEKARRRSRRRSTAAPASREDRPAAADEPVEAEDDPRTDVDPPGRLF